MDKQIRELNKKIAALEKKINDAQNQERSKRGINTIKQS